MQNEIRRLRRKFREGREELFASGACATACRELLERHSALIDDIVGEIYRASCRFADQNAICTRHSGLAIVATGGYGRRELSPFSDIDIAFIPSEEEDPWVEAAVHTAFKLVMDVFLSSREFRVGYSYRPVSEIGTWDLATLTSLLDARHLCGDERLTDILKSQLLKTLSPLDLVLEIQLRVGFRIPTANSLLYSVEPNLKDGPGSLRDLHFGRWIFKLLLGVGEDDLKAGLLQNGYLSSVRMNQVQEAAEWFWRARNWLHLTTGKRSDVLINNYQDRIARELGGVASQEWLSQHYAHSETLARFRASALQNALAGPLDMSGIRVENGYMCFPRRVKPAALRSSVRMFQLSQHYSIAVSPQDLNELEDLRSEALAIDEASSEEAGSFLSILREGRDIAPTIRALIQMGLMDRFISRFSELMRFAPPDPAHRYTVGEHSLKIIENLEALKMDRSSGSRRFSELVAQCSHFDMLCLAALLHDAGKMMPGDDHSVAVMNLTRNVAMRLALAPEKQEILEILVRHHLLLVRTARLQDLKSPAVIQAAVEKIPNVDALRHLYVFTYADTLSVAEKNWTSLDDRDLEELYKKVQNHLEGLAADTGAVDMKDKLSLIRRKLGAANGGHEDEAIRKHCDAMPASYVLNTPLGEIAFHIKLLSRLEEEQVVLDIYNPPGDDYSELTVCTYDDPRPGMLAKIAGVLYGCNVDIHKAQVFTMDRNHPVALDTIWMRSGGMQISENRARRIRNALRDILADKTTLEQFLMTAGKQPPSGIPLDNVELRNDLSEEHTVVHIVAHDLQGLLYLMTRGLSRSGLHIHTAKVGTWNARAENNFYVTMLSGGQIPNEDLPTWTEQLRRVFQGQPPE
jgi:[protein-PII] uridylyltransferase